MLQRSDLGLHCLPMSTKKDARLIWVNMHTLLSCGGRAKSVKFGQSAKFVQRPCFFHF